MATLLTEAQLRMNAKTKYGAMKSSVDSALISSRATSSPDSDLAKSIYRQTVC